MVEENAIQDCYENCKWKTVVGFPEHYCDLSYEQKRFVEELLQLYEEGVNYDELESMKSDIEDLTNDVEDLEDCTDRIRNSIRSLKELVNKL